MDDHTVLNDEGRGVSFSSRAAVIAGNTPWRGCDVLVVSRNPPSIIKRGSQNSSVGNRMRSTIRSFQVNEHLITFTIYIYKAIFKRSSHVEPPFVIRRSSRWMEPPTRLDLTRLLMVFASSCVWPEARVVGILTRGDSCRTSPYRMLKRWWRGSDVSGFSSATAA